MCYKILVVDDEQEILTVINDLLVNHGYEISSATDGMEALNKVNMEKFDLYILDIMIPGMNGLELMHKIKQADSHAVIIIITGYPSIEGIKLAIRSGAYHYLTKPITKDELFKVVEAGLLRHEEIRKNVHKPIPGLLEEGESTMDSLLLRGFSTEEKQEFHKIAETHIYDPGYEIPMLDDLGSIILIKNGDVSVWNCDIQVESLHSGDSWGEETFISPSYLFTNLKAETEATIQHYNRGIIVDYFTYKDESLTKKFTINLVTILYLKWKKAIFKTGSFNDYTKY
jgi:DNA-binding response OmpR family regulator